MASLLLNGKTVTVNAEPDTPLLWVLRDHLKLTGTKFGCGASLCGACTGHLDGAAIRSCVTPLSAVAGKRITSIEGLRGPVGAAVQAAWAPALANAVYSLTGKRIRSTPLEEGGVRFV